MRIKKSKLEQIVREEMAHHISSIMENVPTVEDAHDDKKDKEDEKGQGEKAPTKPQPSAGNVVKGAKPPAQELPKDPADKKLDKLDQDDPDDEEEKNGEPTEPTDDAKSDIAEDLAGKRIQSITMEPKSKIMPGAIEINLTFDEIPDTFRILINKTGKVAFYWRGLHNEI